MKPAGESGTAAGVGLTAVALIFLLIIGYLVTASLTRRQLPTFSPAPAQPRTVPPGTTVLDTVTLDARDTDTWQFLDLDRRTVVLPPDTAGWDLAVRRFHLMVGDAITDLGPIEFDSVIVAPEDRFVGNIAASDTVNPATKRWYRYNVLSHLLEPRGHVYVVRTRERRYAKFEILSYYCPGPVAGCMTIRYSYPLARPGE